MDPVEPVQIDNIMTAVIAGALVVMTGALYAGLFAFGRLWGRSSLVALAYLAFVGLAVCVMVLADALNLGGWWQAITIALLVGYLLAPHGIWHLSVGTHEAGTEPGHGGGRHE